MRVDKYEGIKDLPREPWEDVRGYQQCPDCGVTGKDLSTHAARCKGPRDAGSWTVNPATGRVVKPLN